MWWGKMNEIKGERSLDKKRGGKDERIDGKS